MQITWLLCGHGRESNQGKFILDSKMDWQPVEVGENWCDMITPTRPGYNTNTASAIVDCSELRH